MSAIRKSDEISDICPFRCDSKLALIIIWTVITTIVKIYSHVVNPTNAINAPNDTSISAILITSGINGSGIQSMT